MPGTMSQADLITDLKGILMDAQAKFTGASDVDFKRHLDIAALDMGRVRPRTLLGTVTLVADQPNYAAPADLLKPKYALWGKDEKRKRKPWAANYPGRLPDLSLIENASGALEIWLSPSPTAAQMSDLGSAYKFYYYAGHKVDATAANTTINAGDRHLLLVRATAQAMQELAHNGVTKPVQLGSGGVGSMPKNGTPGALAEKLMELFEALAAP